MARRRLIVVAATAVLLSLYCSDSSYTRLTLAEAIAVVTLRDIAVAQHCYRASSLSGNFAMNFRILKSKADQRLRCLQKIVVDQHDPTKATLSGYTFQLRVRLKGGRVVDWWCWADPTTTVGKGCKYFFVCGDGVIRVSDTAPSNRSKPTGQAWSAVRLRKG